jgi:hypothetical protein
LILFGTPQLSAQALRNSDDSLRLKAYEAVYTTMVSGFSADVKQSLSPISNNQWLLRNHVSILLAGFEEKAQFSESHGVITPLKYQYINKISKKRNSKLHFNPEKNNVIEQLFSKKPLALPEYALDKASFQAQLRLDLDSQTNFTEKEYYLVDRTQYKTYTVRKLGEETITTALGKFTALKLEQRRPGKSKYTLIWLAKDWDYFLLRLQRFDRGSSHFSLDLKSATIGNQIMTGL